MWTFSGGLRANRESSSNVTPGSALEPALSLRISPVRDGAGQEPGFHPKGRPLCFARVFPGHRPLILPGVSNPCAGGARREQRTESGRGLGLGAGAGRSSAAPPARPGHRGPERAVPQEPRRSRRCARCPPPLRPARPRTHTRDLGEALPTQLGIVNPLPSQTGRAPRLSTPPFLPVPLPRTQENLAAVLARG